MTSTRAQPTLAQGLPPQRKAWILFFILALLLHAILFTAHFEWTHSLPMPRMDVQEMDASKLEAIRKQWKQQSLLLNKDKAAPRDEEAPPDARYFSDRNHRVEKEQRAKQTDTLPQEGHPSSPPSAKEKQSAKQSPRQSVRPKHSFPDLKNLGIPYRLQERQQNVLSHPNSPSRDQALLDDQLPLGGENLLNTQESVYYSFYSRLYNAVAPIWRSRIHDVFSQRKVSPGQYTTTVDLIFDQEGTLIAVRRLQSSGITELDQAVEDSWRKIGKFPNPPRGLLDREKQVHVGWTFRVDVGDSNFFQGSPPQRNY